MNNFDRNQQVMNKNDAKNYANNYFANNIKKNCTWVDSFANNQTAKLNNNLNSNKIGSQFFSSENNNYNLSSNNSVKKSQSSTITNISESFSFSKEESNDDESDDDQNWLKQHFENNEKEEMEQLNNILGEHIDTDNQVDESCMIYEEKEEKDIYSLLDELNLSKNILSQNKNDVDFDLLTYLSRSRIHEILYEKFGYANEDLLDELHSCSISMNWKELDLQKWLLDPNNQEKINNYYLQRQNSTSSIEKNEVNQSKEKTVNNKTVSVPEVNEVKNVEKHVVYANKFVSNDSTFEKDFIDKFDNFSNNFFNKFQEFSDKNNKLEEAVDLLKNQINSFKVDNKIEEKSIETMVTKILNENKSVEKHSSNIVENVSSNNNDKYLINKIDLLSFKIDSIDKNFKHTLIEENYRKLLIDNQTETLKNFIQEKMNNKGLENQYSKKTFVNKIENKENENKNEFNSLKENIDKRFEDVFNKIENIESSNNNKDLQSLFKDDVKISLEDNKIKFDQNDSLDFKINEIDKNKSEINCDLTNNDYLVEDMEMDDSKNDSKEIGNISINDISELPIKKEIQENNNITNNSLNVSEIKVPQDMIISNVIETKANDSIVINETLNIKNLDNKKEKVLNESFPNIDVKIEDKKAKDIKPIEKIDVALYESNFVFNSDKLNQSKVNEDNKDDKIISNYTFNSEFKSQANVVKQEKPLIVKETKEKNWDKKIQIEEFDSDNLEFVNNTIAKDDFNIFDEIVEIEQELDVQDNKDLKENIEQLNFVNKKVYKTDVMDDISKNEEILFESKIQNDNFDVTYENIKLVDNKLDNLSFKNSLNIQTNNLSFDDLYEDTKTKIVSNLLNQNIVEDDVDKNNVEIIFKEPEIEIEFPDMDEIQNFVDKTELEIKEQQTIENASNLAKKVEEIVENVNVEQVDDQMVDELNNFEINTLDTNIKLDDIPNLNNIEISLNEINDDFKDKSNEIETNKKDLNEFNIDNILENFSDDLDINEFIGNEVSNNIEETSIENIEENNKVFDLPNKEFINHDNWVKNNTNIEPIDWSKVSTKIKEDNLNNFENKNYNILLENEYENIKVEEQKSVESSKKDVFQFDIDEELSKLREKNSLIKDLTDNTVWEIEDIIKDLSQLNVIDETINDVKNLKEKFKQI